jgi:hypothetical protein
MNKTRYKDDKGKLIIKYTAHSSDEKKVRDDFAHGTRNGYACQLKCADLEMMDVINFSNKCKTERREVEINIRIVEENDRWKLRMKEKEIQKLLKQKEYAENNLKEIKEKLKKLQEE